MHFGQRACKSAFLASCRPCSPCPDRLLPSGTTMPHARLWSTQLQSPIAPCASNSAQSRRRRTAVRPACATNNGSAMSDGSPEAAAPHAPAPSGTVHQPAKRAFATMLVHSEDYIDDPYGATMPPLYQTATFRQPGPIEMGEYDYNRSGNPTRTVLERQLADLEGADRAFAFASGMAALAAVTRLLRAGDHVVAGDDLYGGTSRLLSRVVPNADVSVSNVDTSDLNAVRAAIVPGKTKLVMLESPTNPRMMICDIRAICDLAHAAGALVCVDNSIMCMGYQRPLALGADISMTSATKFIGGHSDVTAGILAVKGKELAERIYFVQNAEGTALGPFDCWLLLRGVKTMALRMERQAENAAKLAGWLSAHPMVRRVNYPGLKGHPGHDVHFRQATSGGSILSFITGDAEVSEIVCRETQLFKITVSFGNVVSLISMPCFMSHASIPADVRAARGLPDDLVRISAGIEAVDDLIADLDQAFQKAAAAVAARAQPAPATAAGAQ